MLFGFHNLTTTSPMRDLYSSVKPLKMQMFCHWHTRDCKWLSEHVK